MNNPWNLSNEELEKKGAINTASEICQQPEAWRDTLIILKKRQPEIESFIKPLMLKKHLQIIFTGAGTSAYVGDTIAPYLREKIGSHVDSVATTDIVATPLQFLDKNTPTILVSFARSGDSPESVAAYDLAEQLVDELYQIIITCNPEGTLAKRAMLKEEHTLTIFTPLQTNDLGFAMTSSFTCMLLSGLMVFDMENIKNNEAVIERLIKCGENILQNEYGLPKLGAAGFERLIFLGSGCLHGLAKESCLKVLELTGGRIAAIAETAMGFRHGPKSIINDKTMIILFLSTNPYTYQYEVDFLKELNNDKGSFKVLAISASSNKEVEALVDYMMVVDETAEAPWGNDAYMALCYVMFDHIFALAASMASGVSPDTPCPSGSVNRVVKGVVIHKLKI